MTNPTSPPANRGLDYNWLRTEGIGILQQLSSDIWTDYNEHDPGVTTLEQLCYALTELSYRAGLSPANLLVDRTAGTIQPYRHGLFIPRSILPCNPVTVDDYRKAIVDRIPAVRNVWLTSAHQANPDVVNGLYDIRAYVPRDLRVSRRRMRRRIRQVYCGLRDLCEDVHSIHILRPRSTVVHDEVTLGPDAVPDTVLATIFFQVEQLLAPELQRQPLSALVQQGDSPDRIFNGPLLRRGFISDDQLLPEASSIAVNDIIGTISSVAGVTATSRVRVAVHDHSQTYRLNDNIPVAPDTYLDLDTRPNQPNKRFSIRLVRDGLTCVPDPAGVAAELRLLRNANRQLYPLRDEYPEFFPVPTAVWHDLESYYSIQNQYPVVYGIGIFGPPAHASIKRQAQAKQFKGYLLAFEQLMSDYFAQVANIRNLFSVYPESQQTYYYQSLAKSVPQVEPILRSDYEEGLAKIVSRHDPVIARRNTFLDFLLSLYATRLNLIAFTGCGQCSPDEKDLTRIVHAKLEALRTLVVSTRDRGRAFDYLNKPGPANVAGMVIRCRIELGLDCGKHRRLCDAVAQSSMKLARKRTETSIDESAERYSVHIANQFRPVSSYPVPAAVPDLPASLRAQTASDEFISAAKDLDNLLVGRLPGADTTVLVCNVPPLGWTVIGRYSDLNTAIGEAHAVSRHCGRIHRRRNQLYIVEHNLLRFGRNRHARTPASSTGAAAVPDAGSAGDGFFYEFTLTAVLSLPECELRNRERRRAAREIIRQNTPAHVVAEICFLQPWSMVHFEYLYCEWLDALRDGPRRRLRRACARMRRFLIRHIELFEGYGTPPEQHPQTQA